MYSSFDSVSYFSASHSGYFSHTNFIGSYMRSLARSWRIMFSTIWSKSSFWPRRSNSAIMFVIISSPNCSTCAASRPSMSVADVANSSIVVARERSSSTSGAESGVAASALALWSRTNCWMVLAPSSLPDNARSVISSVSLNAGFRRLSTSRSMEFIASVRISCSSALSTRSAPFSPESREPILDADVSSALADRSSSSSNSAMASSRIASSAASASRCSASRTLRFCAIWRTSDMVERSAARGYVSSCAAGAISLLGPWEGCPGRGAARRNSKRARSRRRRGEASSRARWAAFWASPLVQNHDLFTRRRRRKAEHRAA
mmetsp:Transcript_3423/g.10586  ORF Transcript_3423/g.10586 Transcript_3423/m.10586 type:complete len:319 (-) Transcript_3423:399-1355(-)